MNFVTIDFETANYYRDSACAIGLTIVRDGIIKETLSYLINPETFFDDFNIRIHGITPKTIADAPTFSQIWDTLLPLLENQTIIAHNAMFDIGVLKNSLEQRNLTKPESTTYCTYQLAKRLLPDLPSYTLPHLCAHFGIPLIDHHSASDDSRACAELFLALTRTNDINSFDDILTKASIYAGSINKNSFSNPKRKRVYGDRTDISISADSEFEPDNPFFEKTVVITGTLGSMERKVAFQKIVDIGGLIADRVTKKTDFLIIGQTDFRQVGEKGASRKQLEAEKLSNAGHPIEIVSEDFFTQNIPNKTEI